MKPPNPQLRPEPRSKTALGAALLCLALLPTTLEGAPEERRWTVPVLLLQESGRPVGRARPGDLSVEVAGAAAAVEAISAVSAGDPRVLLYLDLALSRTRYLRALAQAVQGQADELTDIAAVEIVVADPAARQLLAPTRDAALLTSALQRFLFDLEGEDALGERRRAHLAAAPGEDPPAAALADELLMLRFQRDELLAHLSSMELVTPSYLVLGNEALDADPSSFYFDRLEDPGLAATLSAGRLDLGGLAAAAAARGWTVFPFDATDGDGQGEGLSYAPTEELPVGFRLRLGGRDRERQTDDDASRDEALWRPRTGEWRAFAAATGGRVVAGGAEMADAVRQMSGAFLVTVRAPDREVPTADLAGAGPSLRIGAPGRDWRVLAPAVPPGIPVAELNAARARRLLSGDETPGAGLEVDAVLEVDPAAATGRTARLVVEIRDSAEPPPGSPLEPDAGAPGSVPWRVTVGVRTGDREVALRHELADLPRGNPSLHSTQIALPAETDAAVVVVEDRRTGRWGATAVDFVDRAVAGAEAPQPPVDRPIRLRPVDGYELRGKVPFSVETTPEVDRVEYLLNGKRVARRGRPPFDSRIDLGDQGRTLQLVAVAYDRSGAELGRDRLLLNEPPDTFWVRIVEPEPGSRKVGLVDVEAQVLVPRNGTLDGVDFFWRDRRLATVQEPPYRATVRIPVNDPDGFLRAEAALIDGRTSEDVLLMHRAGFGDQIGVELVELYVVATDRSGKPVDGLGESDFQVLEDDTPQEIETFEPAGDLPLTVGLAIDSSSSLFVKMPEVRRAARTFVDSLEPDRDRALLVGFGSEPRLVQRTTRRLERLHDAIAGLEPHGSTAVWGAVNLALQELSGTSGRRALVVFFDGDDEDETDEFRRSLREARRAGLPVYLVILNDEAARTGGRSLSSRSFVARLEAISRAGGGRVFFVDRRTNLDDIFLAISDELRSHYLLTYYPTFDPGGPQWRPVEVRVQKRGVEARTLEGRGVDW